MWVPMLMLIVRHQWFQHVTPCIAEAGTADDHEKQTRRGRFGQFAYFSTVRKQQLRKQSDCSIPYLPW